MALKIWLPLNGNLDNTGTRRPAIAPVGTPTVNNNGKIGKCYTFSGSNGISVAEQILPSQAPEWSFACWFKLANTTSTAAGTFFSERTGGNYNGYTIFLYPNNSKMLIDDGVRWTVTPMTFSANVWYHLVITRSPAGKKLYVNGELKSSTTTVGSTSAVNANGCLIGLAQSGTSLTAGNQGFIGDLNDIRIYDQCLSALEIKEMAQGLILHYKLNGNSGGVGENLVPRSREFDTGLGAATTSTLTTDTYKGAFIRTYNNTISSSYKEIVVYYGILYPELGQSYTMSFWARGSGKITAFFHGASGYVQVASVRNSQGITGTGADGNSTLTLSSDWQRYWVTWTLKTSGDTTVNKHILIRHRYSDNATVNMQIAGLKLEKGPVATPWSPSLADYGANVNRIADSSGYGNDGELYFYDSLGSITNVLDSPKYSSSIYINSENNTTNTASGTCYIYGHCGLTNPTAMSVAFWCKPVAGYNSATTHGQFCTTNYEYGNSNVGVDYQASAMNHRDGTININDSASTTQCNVPINFTANEWHHYAVTYDGQTGRTYKDGVLTNTVAFSAAKTLDSFIGVIIGFSRAGSVWRSNKSYYSDFRVYATTLSAADILSLYNTPANIDNLAGIHGFEFTEDNGNRVAKNGLIHTSNISQFNNLAYLKYDPNIYIEPDGSAWVHIYHHNNPSAGSFASTDPFATSVKIDDNRWFNATQVCNQLNKWEFLIKYAHTAGGVEYKERWIQTKNPENAVFGDVDAADITRITGNGYKTGTWGGLYKKNSSAYWVMNNGNSGNWWGATGSFSIYQGGIPGYVGGSGVITTTGYNDLYVRIDNVNISNVEDAKITKNNLYIGDNIIEK